jgi:hypothetical protein
MDPSRLYRIAKFLRYELPAKVQVLERILPELGLFDDDTERRNAFRRATRGLPLTIRSVGLVVLLLSAVGAVLCIILALLGIPDRVQRWVVVPLAGVWGAPAIVYGLAYMWRRRIRQSLRQQLRLLGIPLCEKCGYDLRGSIESARCPECGTPFVPPKLPGGTALDPPDEVPGSG